MFTLLIVAHYGSVLCFYLKLQQASFSHFRFRLPPLDHNVDFQLVTHVVSSFRLHVKLKSKFAKFTSEVNLVQNLILFILTKQTVNCFSLGLMETPLQVYILMQLNILFVERLPVRQSRTPRGNPNSCPSGSHPVETEYLLEEVTFEPG